MTLYWQLAVSCCVDHSQQRCCALAGIPESSTNEEMRKHFSEAIAYFRGSPFTYAFLHTDPARRALDPKHPPQHALLYYSSLDGKLVPEVVIKVQHDALQDDLQLLLQLHGMQRIVCGEQHKHYQILGPGSLQMLRLMYVLTLPPVKLLCGGRQANITCCHLAAKANVSQLVYRSLSAESGPHSLIHKLPL